MFLLQVLQNQRIHYTVIVEVVWSPSLDVDLATLHHEAGGFIQSNLLGLLHPVVAVFLIMKGQIHIF